MEASEFLEYKNWVVVGDVSNSSKYAYKILNSLKNEGFNVVGVNSSDLNEGVYKSLKEVPYKIEVLDLCINPYKGIKIIQEAKELKIEKILIQPGAESVGILDFCEENEMKAVEGCALVELSKR